MYPIQTSAILQYGGSTVLFPHTKLKIKVINSLEMDQNRPAQFKPRAG